MAKWKAFAVGFFPGIFIGCLSSILFLLIWTYPLPLKGVFFREMIAKYEDIKPVFLERISKSRITGTLSRHIIYSEEFCDDKNGNCDKIHLKSKTILDRQYLLLILIHSTPLAFAKRNAIRTTWLQDNKNKNRFMWRFVIGIRGLNSLNLTSLASENMKYGDLLLIPDVLEPETLKMHHLYIRHKNHTSNYSRSKLNEKLLSSNQMLDINSDENMSYKNNTYLGSRKLLKSFVWAEENANFHYIFKCTDSTFANLNAILHSLERRRYRRRGLTLGVFCR